MKENETYMHHNLPRVIEIISEEDMIIIGQPVEKGQHVELIESDIKVPTKD